MSPALPAPGSDLDAAFAALGDPVRRALVSRLAQGDATVGEFAALIAERHLGTERP